MVVVPVLDVVAAYGLDFASASIVLPVEKVDVLEEFTLVESELADHESHVWAVAERSSSVVSKSVVSAVLSAAFCSSRTAPTIEFQTP